MGRASLREKIIESGAVTLYERGFTASGIREITSAAGVPLGSFTNHFRSKDAFGVAVLDHYFEGLHGVAESTLLDQSRTPLDRLQAYFDAVADRAAAGGWRHGCLISNLSLETAEHSELLRHRLAEILHHLTGFFAEAVRASQAAGEIRDDLDADDIAAALLAAWHGALLRMKVERSPEPLERFRRVNLASLLCEPGAGRAAARKVRA